MIGGASEQKRVLRSAEARRSVEEAMQYVGKSWMPICARILAEIRQKLKAGKYIQNPAIILEDLKKDFGLYTWFLSQLPSLGASSKTGKMPSELVHQIEAQKLVEIFNVPDDQISLHRLEGALKPQSLSLKQAIISSTTAETLATSAQLDTELVHTCATIRQLGVSLVAWNYPRIYTRALQNVSQGKGDLETELQRVLGYAPSQLASQLCLSWDQTNQIDALVQASATEEKPPEAEEMEGGLTIVSEDSFKELQRCWLLGESVGRLSDPEHYPQEATQWQQTLQQVQTYLGPKALDILRGQFDSIASGYGEAPGQSSFNLALEPENLSKAVQNQIVDKFLENNSWVLKCPQLFQEKFRAVYATVDSAGVSTTAINVLIADVIPALGFTRGCVYLVEPTKMILNPVVRVGASPLSRYRPLSCSSEKTNHPVVLALSYTTPIIQERVPINGELVSHVTGVFGNEHRTGVLYLEMSDKLASSADRHEALIYFKAARQTLVDCLNLRK